MLYQEIHASHVVMSNVWRDRHQALIKYSHVLLTVKHQIPRGRAHFPISLYYVSISVYKFASKLVIHCVHLGAFSRRFYPKRLTIRTFVIRSASIYRCRYRKDVHRTKCKYHNR